MSKAAELAIISDYVSEFADQSNDCKSFLPIDSSNVLSKLQDGLILAKLTQEFAKDDLPNRSINNPAADDAAKTANKEAVVKALKKKLDVDVNASDIETLAKTVVMAHLQQSVNLIESIAIIRTLKDGEGLDVMLQMAPKNILGRWVNYHLSAAGVELPEDQDDFVEDIHKDLTVEYLFKLLKQLDTKGLVTDTEASAESIMRTAEILEVNKFVSVESINSNWALVNEAFLSHVFNNHPGIYLPTEEEMDHIMKEIRTLQQRLKECEDGSKEMDARAKQIKDDMAKLTEKKDSIANENQYHALVKQLDLLQAQRQEFDDETNKLLAEQKAKIAELQAKLDELNAINNKLQEQVKGQGQEVAELNNKLTVATNNSNEKSRAIQEHAEKLRERFNEWGAADQLDANPNVTIKTVEDDREQLELCLAAQKKMIESYKDSLESVNDRFERQKTDAKRRIEEINALVSEYLGSGEANAGDAIANMKRLLELMIEKCKKQSKQIATYDLTIEKMDDLSTLMREKIKVYAEKNTKKKGLFTKSK